MNEFTTAFIFLDNAGDASQKFEGNLRLGGLVLFIGFVFFLYMQPTTCHDKEDVLDICGTEIGVNYCRPITFGYNKTIQDNRRLHAPRTVVLDLCVVPVGRRAWPVISNG